VIAFIVLLAKASQGAFQPLGALDTTPISLDPGNLPEYAARTAIRMLAAMALSLLFTFAYATAAAKSRRAELLLIPLLDILQSVPILGFISVTIVFFMSLAPGRVLGAEFAAVFAIFTSQAWNMAFSFYQSLRTVPRELREVGRCFRLPPWTAFWRIDAAFGVPSLVWNMMVSMSGGWFFVVAAEAINVGHTTIALPGIGSYIALAIERRDLTAIGWAIGAMLVVILLYDQLLFRPLIAWAARFRYDNEPGVIAPTSWVLNVLRRSILLRMARRALARRLRPRRPRPTAPQPAARRPPAAHQLGLGSRRPFRAGWADHAWQGFLAVLAVAALLAIGRYIFAALPLAEVGRAVLVSLATAARVLVLIGLASLVWVPVGVWIGFHPGWGRLVQPVAQFLAAFPANLLFPIAVFAIATWKLDPDVWLSPLMIFGTQWYILFNVIAGASAMPGELRDVGTNLGVRGWLWWRKVALPGIFPYFLTGAITASGGSWNASIVAEYVNWGDKTLTAYGIGAYIAQATADGDFHRIALGITVMSLFVVAINRALWRPLYRYAERKFQLG
jgi:NitT/TauT family transport system permease protein